MKSKSPNVARYTPECGVVLGETIREQVQALVNEGYFDKADCIVLGVANRDAYDVRWAGSKFDCYGLLGVLKERLGK